MGFTHYGAYYGIPVYLGDLEFAASQPITVMTQSEALDWLFTLVSLVEWLFTPPNGASLFKVGPEIKESDE